MSAVQSRWLDWERSADQIPQRTTDTKPAKTTELNSDVFVGSVARIMQKKKAARTEQAAVFARAELNRTGVRWIKDGTGPAGDWGDLGTLALHVAIGAVGLDGARALHLDGDDVPARCKVRSVGGEPLMREGSIYGPAN